MTDLPPRVLYKDALILVIDKPAGLAVHSGPGGGPSLEPALEGLRFGYKERPELAHRLDRDTSGCLVLGRNARALRKLGALFSSGRVNKVYWAIVKGMPPADTGRIDALLKKLNDRRGWRMVVDKAGQKSVTDYHILGRGTDMAWMELAPKTGRTHQLRVHSAHAGFPILGDTLYDPVGGLGMPLHLHARSISLPLYEDKPPIFVTADPPSSMIAALTACGYQQE